jgi:hypothetical protein
MTAFAHLAHDERTVLLLSLILSGIVQGIYDTLLHASAKCACVRSCPIVLKYPCLCLGKCILAIKFLVSLSFGAAGVLVLLTDGRNVILPWDHSMPPAPPSLPEHAMPPPPPFWRPEAGARARIEKVAFLFAVAKLQSFCVWSVLVAACRFALRRRSHQQPTDEAALATWRQRPACREGNVPHGGRQLWDAFIGADKSMADLPEMAPAYPTPSGVFCCCRCCCSYQPPPDRVYEACYPGAPVFGSLQRVCDALPRAPGHT